ncbi:MAG: hypothetical protein J6R18_07770 [Kiritimatiellae bacterium]|nr:hypothetical protein [Kiritimatiellia bacterium]
MKKLLMMTVVLAGAVTLLAGEFMAGYAKTDITPPLGVFMPGYYKVRRAKEILDPLSVVCVAFSDGKTKAVVMQLDTEAVSDMVADQMRDAIVKATGIDRNAIIIHASHTHDGGQLAMKTNTAKEDEISDIYRRMAVSRVADAAVNAIRDLKPAKLSYQRSVAKRISFGRRYLMKDGKVRTNPGVNNPDIVGPYGDPADEEVQVLRIDCEGADPICVINFQTHPDVVGNETITADWPGLTRTVFEAATLGKTRCIVINGTQGDVNHVNVMPRPGERNGLKRDFDDVDRGYDHAWHMANVLASSALSVWMKCIPMEAGDVRFTTVNVKVPANKAKDSDEKNLKWAQDVWAKHKAGKPLPWKAMELTTEVARAGRIIRMSTHPGVHEIPLFGISIGKAVAFGAFPGEPFNKIGVEVKKASPFKMTIMACLTNGSRGYFPFSDAYKTGGYESATSPFGPTVADDLIAGQLKMLNGLYK